MLNLNTNYGYHELFLKYEFLIKAEAIQNSLLLHEKLFLMLENVHITMKLQNKYYYISTAVFKEDNVLKCS